MTYAEFIDFNKHTAQGEYTQKHHIVPVSIGGKNTKDNFIEISWLTHYYAHYLLAKENPDNEELQIAFKTRGDIDSFLKNCYANYKHIGENHPMYGKHHSEETKRKQSIANTGVEFSEERRENLSKAMLGNTNKKGKKEGEEARKRKSEAQKIRWAKKSSDERLQSDESKRKKSESMKLYWAKKRAEKAV